MELSGKSVLSWFRKITNRFERHPIPYFNVISITLLTMGISTMSLPKFVTNGILILSVLFGIILVKYIVLYKNLPQQKLLAIGLGAILATGLHIFYGSQQATLHLLWEMIYFAVPLSFIYESKQVVDVIRYYILSDDTRKIFISNDSSSVYVNPVYFVLFFKYIPNRIKSKLSQNEFKIIILQKGKERTSFVFQFDSKEEFIKEITEPKSEFTGAGVCRICEENTTIYGPYECVVSGSDKSLQSSIYQCSQCREEIINTAISENICTEEELLVSTI